MAYLEFRGARDLSAGLKKLANLDDVKDTVRLNGSEMKRNMKSDAPVDTGFLWRNILLDIEDNGFTAHVGSYAEYSPYLIMGTRYMYAQDFFRPNFYAQKNQFNKDLDRLLK